MKSKGHLRISNGQLEVEKDQISIDVGSSVESQRAINKSGNSRTSRQKFFRLGSSASSISEMGPDTGINQRLNRFSAGKQSLSVLNEHVQSQSQPSHLVEDLPADSACSTTKTFEKKALLAKFKSKYSMSMS